jgi:membrane-bound metal-dependent hydrolase YbcI (DUF457 family)
MSGVHPQVAWLAVVVAITKLALMAAAFVSWRVAAPVMVGWLVAIAGDMCTMHGCPLWWPWSRRDRHLLPRALRMRTGRGAELIGVAPMLWIGVAVSVLVLARIGGLGPWLVVLGAAWALGAADGMRRLGRSQRRES